MILRRVVSGVAAFAAALGAVLAGGWILVAAASALAVGACFELRALLSARGADCPLGAACAGSIAMIAVAQLGRPDLFAAVIALVFLGIMSWQALAGRVPGALLRPAAGTFAVAYVGWPLGAVVAVRSLGGRMAAGTGRVGAAGAGLLLTVLLSVWATDTAAFFGGTAVGRIHPWRAVSPSKSLEGAVCGTLAGVAVGVATIWVGPRLGLVVPRPGALSYGLIAAVVLAGQVGDLAESALKRDAKVKDSGRFLPGHGGFLDRMDSVLVASLVAYYYVVAAGPALLA